MALVKLRPNLVKLIKNPPILETRSWIDGYNMFRYFKPFLALIWLPRFACQKPGKILRVKMGYDTAPASATTVILF
jgi:hypothetical protein